MYLYYLSSVCPHELYNHYELTFFYLPLTPPPPPSQDIDWHRYLNLIFNNVSINLTMEKDVIVYAPDFLRNLAALIKGTASRSETFLFKKKKKKNLLILLILFISM